jgi:hypothetical protein
MDTKVDEPAIHEYTAEGDEHARDLKVQTVFRVRLFLRAVFDEERAMKIGKATADYGAGDKAEACSGLKEWNCGGEQRNEA